MLKRYQVLLTEWQEKYIKYLNKKYDLSDSSVIRIHLGFAILYGVQLICPEYITDISQKNLQELSKKAARGELQEEELHQEVAKIHLEARKMVERMFSKVNKEQ